MIIDRGKPIVSRLRPLSVCDRVSRSDKKSKGDDWPSVTPQQSVQDMDIEMTVQKTTASPCRCDKEPVTRESQARDASTCYFVISWAGFLS